MFLSALTPDKDRGIRAFLANVHMGTNVCEALTAVAAGHVVYVSSDAVYPFANAVLSTPSTTFYFGLTLRVRPMTLSVADVVSGRTTNGQNGPRLAIYSLLSTPFSVPPATGRSWPPG